jgi:serine/threonine-protein kinase
MATAAGARYPTAGEMARALRAWLDGRSEKERRHREAEDLAAKGREAAEGFKRARELAKEAEAAARAEAARHDPWRPVSEKREMLDARRRAREARVNVALSFAEAVKHLDAALIAEEENAAARAALAGLWEERLEDAERRRDEADVAYALKMIGRYDAGALRSEGSLRLASDPPGAQVALCRYVDRDGVLVAGEERGLGGTPLGPVELEAGSYLCVLRKRGFRDTRYPVRIARNRTWEGTVRLRTDEEVGEGFVHVPAGPFLYGEGEEARIVELPDFAIAKWPVTFREYLEFLDGLPAEEADRRKPLTPGDGPYVERGPDGRWRPLPILVEGKAHEFCIERYGEGFEWRIPVTAISFDDAVAYCAWKTQATGREWRLPTEEEREKAARGADGRRFAWGDLDDASLGLSRESRPHDSQPEPIGAFPAAESVYGMGDASGGTWDWTDSWFDERHSARRVLRGGSWLSPPAALRCASRLALLPRERFSHAGLRCARSL